MEREHHAGVLDGRPQRFVLRSVVGLRSIGDGYLDRAVAELRGAFGLLDRGPDVVHRGHRHRRETVAVGAEVLARPVVPRLCDRELVVRRRRHEQTKRLVRIDDLGAHAVALQVGEAPLDVAPAARVLAELAVAVVFGGAGLGDIEPPGTPPVHDVIPSAVSLHDMWRPVPERFRDALVELGWLLHVRIGRDDLVHLSSQGPRGSGRISSLSVPRESRTPRIGRCFGLKRGEIEPMPRIGQRSMRSAPIRCCAASVNTGASSTERPRSVEPNVEPRHRTMTSRPLDILPRVGTGVSSNASVVSRRTIRCAGTAMTWW